MATPASQDPHPSSTSPQDVIAAGGAPSKARLLRFWVCSDPSLVRLEYSTPTGTEQSVTEIHEPSADTDWRPSVGFECPDDLREEVAEVAWEVIEDGHTYDRRWAGFDACWDAAYTACDEAFEQGRAA